MSGQLGELVVSLQADLARFREDMGKANKVAQDQMRQISGEFTRGANTIERSFAGVAAVTAGAFSTAAIMAFAKETVAASLAAEKLNLQFKAAAGNAELAAKELGYIKGVSRNLGLDFADTATAYGKFMAATRNTSIEGETSRRVFEGVSKAVTALGLRSDEAAGIFLALSQMMSKGKVSAEELNGQLGERLPGALKLAADGMGLTTAELMKQMQAGKIMSSDLLPKLAAEMEKTYGKAAEEAATKGQASINRFKNEILETEKAIGNKLRPALDKLAAWGADGLKTIRENPQGPLDHVFRLIAWAETGKFVNGPNPTAANANIDPQMARVEADRRARQEETNRQRAAAEKLAASADEAAKARAKALAEEERRQEAALRATNKQLEYQNQLLEKAVKDWDLAGLGSGLLDDPLKAPKPRKPSFSLTGAPETMGYGGNPTWSDDTVAAAQKEKAELLQIESSYNKELMSMKFDLASQAADLAMQMAGDSKGAAIAALTFQKAITVAQILLSTESAAMAALAPPPLGLGPVAGMPYAGSIRAMGYASAAIAGVSGMVEAAKIDGRASGGPVTAGTPYIVGEKRPELFVPGQSGTIVPYVPQGGGKVDVTNVYNVSTGVQDTIRAELFRMGPAFERLAINSVRAAMQRGELQR